MTTINGYWRDTLDGERVLRFEVLLGDSVYVLSSTELATVLKAGVLALGKCLKECEQESTDD